MYVQNAFTPYVLRYLSMYCTYVHTYITIKIYIHSLHPDVDECSDENDGCSQTCTNTEGSYICGCNTGFVLDSNGATCNGEYYMNHTHMFIQRNIICMYKMHLLPTS